VRALVGYDRYTSRAAYGNPTYEAQRTSSDGKHTIDSEGSCTLGNDLEASSSVVKRR